MVRYFGSYSLKGNIVSGNCLVPWSSKPLVDRYYWHITVSVYYSESWWIMYFITGNATWVPWHLKAPTTRLFVQKLVRDNITVNLNVQHYRPSLSRKLTVVLVVPRTKDHQLYGKRFHAKHGVVMWKTRQASCRDFYIIILNETIHMA